MTPVYSGTCINRYALKRSTDTFRRTDTPDLVCFLYASLSHISKAETFFQSSDKKATCLLPYKNFRNSEKQIIKLEIFVNFLKKKHFLHFKTGKILFDFILQFWKSTIYLSRSQYLFYTLPSATNQQLFCVTESDIGKDFLNHTPTLHELLPSELWLTLSFGEVSMTCKRMH